MRSQNNRVIDWSQVLILQNIGDIAHGVCASSQTLGVMRHLPKILLWVTPTIDRLVTLSLKLAVDAPPAHIQSHFTRIL